MECPGHPTRFLVVAPLCALVGLSTGCCKNEAPKKESVAERPVVPDNTCPAKFRLLPGFNTPGEKTCTCGANSGSGPVWGSDIYTSDSSVCAAAVHAGVIPPTGGEVKATYAPGCAAYESTTRNGIRSAPWHAYGDSFFFPGHGTGRCPCDDISGTWIVSGSCGPDVCVIKQSGCTTAFKCGAGAKSYAGKVTGHEVEYVGESVGAMLGTCKGTAAGSSMSGTCTVKGRTCKYRGVKR